MFCDNRQDHANLQTAEKSRTQLQFLQFSDGIHHNDLIKKNRVVNFFRVNE